MIDRSDPTTRKPVRRGLARASQLGLAALAFVCSFWSAPAPADPQANRIFVEATEAYSRARSSEADDYAIALANYEQARAGIERLIRDYPHTDLVAGLASGQALVGIVPLHEFRREGERLAFLAQAERDPLTIAVDIALTGERDVLSTIGLLSELIPSLVLAERSDDAKTLLRFGEALTAKQDRTDYEIIFRSYLIDKLLKQASTVVALQVARNSSTPTMEVMLVSKVANTLAKQESTVDAMDAIDSVMPAVDRITEPKFADEAKARLARALGNAGSVEAANTLAESIKTPLWVYWLAAQRLLDRLEAGDIAAAQSINQPDAVPDSSARKEWARFHLARAIWARTRGEPTAADHMRDVMETARQEPDYGTRVKLLAYIHATALKHDGELAGNLAEETLSQADTHLNAQERAEAYLLISAAYHEAGDTETAIALRDRALALEPDYHVLDVLNLTHIAVLSALRDDLGTALVTVQQAPSANRDHILGGLAQALSEQGDLEHALEMVYRIESNQRAAMALGHVGTAYHASSTAPDAKAHQILRALIAKHLPGRMSAPSSTQQAVLPSPTIPQTQ